MFSAPDDKNENDKDKNDYFQFNDNSASNSQLNHKPNKPETKRSPERNTTAALGGGFKTTNKGSFQAMDIFGRPISNIGYIE